jgi:hypothetical protein
MRPRLGNVEEKTTKDGNVCGTHDPCLLEGVFGSAPIRREEEQAATADKAWGGLAFSPKAFCWRFSLSLASWA